MEKDFLELRCQVTTEFKEKILEIIHQLELLHKDFSDCCSKHHNIRFAEYSFLYHDLNHFYTNDLEKRGWYNPKDVISFRNSFHFLYQRLNTYYLPNQTKLENWFMLKSMFFELHVNALYKEWKETEPAA